MSLALNCAFGGKKLIIMTEIRKDLLRIKTYADKIKKSTTHVYQLAKEGKLTIVVIDNIKFVKVA